MKTKLFSKLVAFFAFNLFFVLTVVSSIKSYPLESVQSGKTNQKVDSIYSVVDKSPEFKGGLREMLKYIYSNVKYPEDAKDKQLSGDVICSFIVEKDGSITNIEVKKKISTSLDKEAVRVIQSMPKWNPGELKGEKVRTKYALPIRFEL